MRNDGKRREPSREPDVYTVPEAGERLGISRDAAYDAAARGELPTIRIGRTLRVPRHALEQLLAGGAPQ